MFEVRLNVVHKPLIIPYARDESDKSSHSFIDLRKEPEKINLIPEITDWPELRQTIIKLNDPKGLFKTLGCAEFQYENCEKPYIVTYVGFCFENAEFCLDKFSYYELYHRFTKFVDRGKLPDELTIKMELRYTVFYEGKEENIAGWSMNYYLLGVGAAKEERRKIPNLGYLILCDFITFFHYCPVISRVTSIGYKNYCNQSYNQLT